jgi:hypothetical protein
MCHIDSYTDKEIMSIVEVKVKQRVDFFRNVLSDVF